MTSISHAAPFRHVTHAGAQYVLAHARVLQDWMSIVFYVPETPENELAGQDPWSDNIGVRVVRPDGSRWEKFVSAARVRVDPYGWTTATSVIRAVQRRKDVLEQLRTSDIVELQWLEYFPVARFVRKAAPHARIIGVVHDVSSQRMHRELSNSDVRWIRWYASPQRKLNQFRERHWLSSLDAAIVFSEKDADLVREIRPTCAIEVVHPDLEEPGMSDLQRSNSEVGQTVIFVGNFFRPENEAAAAHLIENLWPEVSAVHSDAQLILVGVNPSHRMRAAAARCTSVTITGEVESLAPYYSSARCAVIPLVNGAGVKFKTISAMLWAVPVVSTHVGIEGIGPDDLFYAVSDSDEGLIDGMVRCLVDENAYTEAEATREWARSRYTTRPFRKRLREIYFVETNASGTQ